jgi:hypothetical protein
VTSPWPAPDAQRRFRNGRRPNYALRRVIVIVGVFALAASGVVAWSLLRDEGGSEGSAAGRGWDLVVTQDMSSRTITVHDASGKPLENLDSIETDFLGVADSGVPGTALVGLAGDVEIDGIGVLDLRTGRIRPIEIGDRDLTRLGATGWWLAAEATGTALELLDVRGRTLVDLFELAGIDPAVDEPIAPGAGVRIEPEGRVLAFSEFRSSSTVVVDTEARTAVTVPGDLADLTATRVATTTNRGDTALLDLSDAAGERLGTAEVPRPAGVLIVDDDTVLTIALDGSMRTIDFSGDDPSVSELPDISAELPADRGELFSGTRTADGTRLAVQGEGFVAVVDSVGNLVGVVDVPIEGQYGVQFGPTRPTCFVIGGTPTQPTLVVDATTATVVAEFEPGAVFGSTDDQCTLAVSNASGTRSQVRGPDTEATVEAGVRALAPDGSALIEADRTAARLFILDGGETIDLTSGPTFAAFAQR